MQWLQALSTLANPACIAFMLLGCIIGIIGGALPGIGASLTMSLLIPFTFTLPKTIGLPFLIAAWSAVLWGGSITAILLNTPGTGGNVATCFDGFPLSEKGRGGVGLGISAMSSMVGGLVGIIVLILFAPLLASFSLRFGPAEYFLLAIFGMSIIATTTEGAALKGLIGAGIGLLISLIGYDLISGEIRYDFGTLYLQDGIPFLDVIIGLFAVSQAFVFAEELEATVAKAGKVVGSAFEGILIPFKYVVTLVRSCLIGVIFGFAPGVGTAAANMVAWTEAKRSSSHPETFGSGDEEGLVAAETANNAVQGGALIPALTLGIPGNSDSAVFLVALMMYGITPGKDLFGNNPDLVYVLFTALLIGQILFFAIGVPFSNLWAKVTIVPTSIVMPVVLITCYVGAFALRNNIWDILTVSIFGLLGYIMKKLKFPVVPMMLAVILGPIAEKNFYRALLISGGSFKIFVSSLISQALILLIVFALAFPYISSVLRTRRQKNRDKNGALDTPRRCES
ncbi:MAG: C4-dicarboxylate ABC transporter permease [Firmicutes bacterium]|nr:C4-dicarboxylate ABC transporter permease [Bacillota bacterium]